MTCPASISMEAQVPPQRESVYAAEGTAAHALAEIKASLAFGKIDKRLYIRRRDNWRNQYDISPEVESEMEVHTDAYVDLLLEMAETRAGTVVLLEQRLKTGVPKSWGTSDAVLLSPGYVGIVDFKYGMGVRVDAMGNPQLRLYALGALDMADLIDDVETVSMTVHQPRLNHTDTDYMTAEDLRTWRSDVVIPIAREALGDDAHFGPSEEACRWCPASGRCRAQLEDIFKTDFFDEPATLTGPELAEALKKVRHVEAWLEALREAALDAAYSQGLTIPGYKVVRSHGRRAIVDPEGASARLKELGYLEEEFSKPTALRGIGELEKLMGEATFRAELAPYINKPEGKPALVTEDDSRPAIDPNSDAQKEFSE